MGARVDGGVSFFPIDSAVTLLVLGVLHGDALENGAAHEADIVFVLPKDADELPVLQVHELDSHHSAVDEEAVGFVEAHLHHPKLLWLLVDVSLEQNSPFKVGLL